MERLSLAFTNLLDHALGGERQNVRPVSVELSEGGTAEAVLKALQPITSHRLVVLGLARNQRSGLVVGERHVHMRGAFDWLRWHTHNPAFCRGFAYQDGTFTAASFGALLEPSTRSTGASEGQVMERTDIDERAARLGIRIVQSLLDSDPEYDLLAPSDSEAFRWAKSLIPAEGGPSCLLVDPVLQLALMQRIGEGD